MMNQKNTILWVGMKTDFSLLMVYPNDSKVLDIFKALDLQTSLSLFIFNESSM